MKIPKSFLLLFIALLPFGLLTPTHARAQVTVSFFYDNLDPYGEWVDDPDYGYVWHPTNVDENWAPYTDGYWAYTDGGWTWVSYEDYGGIVYHYGRWARVEDEGWVWVPGETWAPAWVSWRVSDDYVGWAPLPPEARWSAGIGFSTWVDARFDIGPGCYSFVNVGDFGAPALGAVIVNREQNVTIINNTTNITNITTNNSTVYTGGPSYARIAAHSKRPIPTLKLVRQGDASLAQGGKTLAHQQGNQLMVIAPRVTAPAGGKLPPPPKVARTLSGGKVDHGWNIVKDPGEREKLQARYKEQAGSSETAPAKPVNPDDVKLVNEKIKSKGPSTEEGAPKPLAEEGATPKSGKGKGKKATDLNALENTPAAEEPGTAAETPKSHKGKKSHATPEEGSPDTSSAPEETPKIKKSKKHETPGDEENGSADSEAPSKHSKKSESNLQPFMSGGDETPEPKKSKKSSEYSPKESEETPKSYENRPSDEGRPGEARTPKGDKGEKSDKGEKKKSKEDQGPYPPGQ